jgi:hypothetical protein
MSIIIDDPDLERDLRALAAARGESVETLVRQGLNTIRQEAGGAETSLYLEAQTQPTRGGSPEVPIWLRELQARYREAVVDLESTDDELLGYDEHGLPS